MTKTMKRTMLASLVTATLLTAGVALNTQAVDASSECLLTMRAGASVRIDEETGTGIRFTANIDESLVKVDGEGETATYSIDYTKGVTEVGMIVVPSFTLDGLEANEDVFAHLQADWNAPKSEVSAIPGKVYKDDNGYFVAGAIVELKDANFNRRIERCELRRRIHRNSLYLRRHFVHLRRSKRRKNHSLCFQRSFGTRNKYRKACEDFE